MFLVGLSSVILTAACGFSCLHLENGDFRSFWTGSLALLEMVLGVYPQESISHMRDQPVEIVGAYIFLIITVIFLLNLLISQLSGAYDAIYADMVGFARLKRLRIIIEAMPQVSPLRWGLFRTTLKLDTPVEFNEGDVGVPGGLQVLEVASAHPTTTDSIKRFGGSTSETIQWPEETNDDETDRFERIEGLVKKVNDELMKQQQSGRRMRGAKGSSGGMSSGNGSGHNSGNGSNGAGSAGSAGEGSAGEEVDELEEEDVQAQA